MSYDVSEISNIGDTSSNRENNQNNDEEDENGDYSDDGGRADNGGHRRVHGCTPLSLLRHHFSHMCMRPDDFFDGHHDPFD